MNKIRNVKRSFNSSDESFFSEAMEFIDSSLKSLSVNKKLIPKTELISEETISELVKSAPDGAVLDVQVKHFLGDTTVTLRMKGEEFEELPIDEHLTVDGSEEVIRAFLLRSYGENFKYRNKNHVNHVRISTGQSEKNLTNSALFALLLGLLFGLLVKFLLPQGANDIICDYVLSPVKTIFMHAINIVVAPVVFFSILTSVSQFSDLSQIGKLGGKVMAMYLMTSFIGLCVGLTAFFIFQPGEVGFALTSGVVTEAVTTGEVDTSILSTIVGIVPSNFLSPFLESNTLQIIFLAMLCGLAVGTIGRYSTLLKELFDALNSLFLTVTTMIAKFIPVAAFVSVALMVINLGGSTFLYILKAGMTQLFAVGCMLLVYGLLILLFARLNPITFYKKDRPGMLTALSLCSSSASVPTNMKICTEKMGVSPALANFSIPLGATINMDGVCIYLVVVGLFLARAYGVAIAPSDILSLALSIMLLSLGAPGVPGCAFVCLGVIVKSLNIPIESIGLILAINPILDMVDTVINTTCDMACAVIVAKSENLIDLEKYNS
jgi:Na+/H+-dicarboxylate symporter